jgi:hypothetical protein
MPNSCTIFPDAAGARRLQVMHHCAPTRCLSMISAQTPRLCQRRESGTRPAQMRSRLFRDHAPERDDFKMRHHRALGLLFEHDLFGKPASNFMLQRSGAGIRNNRPRARDVNADPKTQLRLTNSRPPSSLRMTRENPVKRMPVSPALTFREWFCEPGLLTAYETKSVSRDASTRCLVRKRRAGFPWRPARKLPSNS